MKLDNTALITGAARRTGRELAIGLAKRSMNIIIHYHQSEAEAQSLKSELEQLGVQVLLAQADLRCEQSINQMASGIKQKINGLKLLINNVGNYPRGDLMDMGYDEFQQLIKTNVQAPLALTQQFASLLEAQSQIINIGCAGVEHNLVDSNAPAYQLSKAALLNITRTLALELASKKVRVNMISPGHLNNSVDLPDDPQQFPLQRAGTTDDILSAIDYLTTANNYVTGTNIDVGGGYRLGFGCDSESAEAPEDGD